MTIMKQVYVVSLELPISIKIRWRFTANDVSRIQHKNKAQNKLAKSQKTFADYLAHSSIHGIPYIAEKNRSWFERIWWILVISLSAVCCGKLIYDAWKINPINISFTEKPTSIWQVPFPAISICTRIFSQSKQFKLSYTVRQILRGNLNPYRMSDGRKKKLLAINAFCKRIVVYGDLENATNCNDCLETLRKIRVPPEEMFVECRFQNQILNCMDIFKETVIGFGVCHTFNGFKLYRLDSESSPLVWSADEGYKQDAPLAVYPRRALGAGRKYGLSVLLRINKKDIDVLCSGRPSFQIDYQQPHESPSITSADVRVGDSAAFELKPRIITFAEELRKYSVSSRKCYFDNERPLKYFNRYTRFNCELECEVDLILKQCGCFRIIVEDRGNIDICGPYQYNYTFHARSYLHKQNYLECECLPTCSSITFDAKITTLNQSALLALRGVDIKKFECTKVEFFLKETEVMTLQRTELYGDTEFLAKSAGLKGLCLGISVISLFEIVYFCTVRLALNLQSNETIDPAEEQHTNTKAQSFDQVIRGLITDYSQRATIQGISYVADDKLSVMERLWWASTIVISVFCCGSLISDLMWRYDEKPVIISFENHETPITQVPFPAVTICSEHAARDFEKLNFYNFSDFDTEVMTAAAQICDSNIFDDLDPENKTNCDHCSDVLRAKMGLSFDMFEYCFNLGEELCSQLFKQVITEEGVCYTYNGLEIFRNENEEAEDVGAEWTLEGGYKNKTELSDVFPRFGSIYPLNVIIKIGKGTYDGSCKGQINGFRIFLHLPNEVPSISKHYWLAPYQEITEIYVSPNMITTDPELRDLAVDKRQCFFSDERFLRFFKYYTKENCEFECLANLTLAKCGCLRFNMPKIPGVKVCGIGEIRCYHLMVQQRVEKNLKHYQVSECNCLPSCTSISYDADVSQIDMSESAMDVEKAKNFSFSELTVAMRTKQFVALKRSRLYGKTELLADCGGLLGLFLGFSMVSILEFVYFCTIRLLCTFKNHFRANYKQ